MSIPAPSLPNQTMWDNFECAFLEDWTNVNKPYQAAADLDTLRMISNDINSYITQFAELARKALYQENDPTVLKMFKQGLPFKLLDLCMNHNKPNTWEAWKTSTRKCQAIITAMAPLINQATEECQPKPRSNIPPPTICTTLPPLNDPKERQR